MDSIFKQLLGREPRFGDRFKAKDGQMIIYLNYVSEEYRHIWERDLKCPHFCINSKACPRHYRNDGTNYNECDGETIVGLWLMDVDEAEAKISETIKERNPYGGKYYDKEVVMLASAWEEGFKEGYRQAPIIEL